MNSNRIFDQTVQLMRDRLSLNSRSQELVASNLANLNTPGYQSKELSFQRTLQDLLVEPAIQLRQTNGQHLDPFDPSEAMASAVTEETGAVDLDQEMMKLSRNSIEYQFITTMLNKKFTLLKQAIEEGGQ